MRHPSVFSSDQNAKRTRVRLRLQQLQSINIADIALRIFNEAFVRQVTAGFFMIALAPTIVVPFSILILISMKKIGLRALKKEEAAKYSSLRAQLLEIRGALFSKGDLENDSNAILKAFEGEIYFPTVPYVRAKRGNSACLSCHTSMFNAFMRIYRIIYRTRYEISGCNKMLKELGAPEIEMVSPGGVEERRHRSSQVPPGMVFP